MRFLDLIETVLVAERLHGRHPAGARCALSAGGRTQYRNEDLDALADLIDLDTIRQRTAASVTRQAQRMRAIAAIRTAIRRGVTGGADALT